MRVSLVLGIVLLMATVVGADEIIPDNLVVNGTVKADGKISVYGSHSYMAPFAGFTGNSHFIVVRQPTAVSTSRNTGFIFSNNQTNGAFQKVAQLIFMNEASVMSDKRVAQILVRTGGNINSGKMYFRVYDTGVGRDGLTITRTGKVLTHNDLVVGDEVSATVVEVTSDRDAKENVESLDSREVLEKVAALPMSTWSFKDDEDGAVRHMGPMSQDFHAAFGLGKSDKHITTVDADGVALAAIQGLNQKLEEKDAQIQALQKELETLKALVVGLIKD
jgi:hypothetical protein